ncbi:hypothetical protein M5K25_026528 [Dendrobium thyrsiflorum]|uniref:Uncharacterized protein n=1 Tax=Dendrobium thyrsiflorum TaxID=117978 RepID=A0ABD0TXS8_DENTH
MTIFYRKILGSCLSKHPLWIGEGVWANLSRAWASPENKQNRASNCGGLGSAHHTGASVRHTEHRRRLSFLVGSRHHWRCILGLTNIKMIISGLMRKREKLMVSHVLMRDHLQDRPSILSITHGQKRLEEDREGVDMLLRAVHLLQHFMMLVELKKPSVSQRVAGLTREIEKMRQIQAEMQVALRSFRAKHQKNKEQEPVHESQGSEDMDDD